MDPKQGFLTVLICRYKCIHIIAKLKIIKMLNCEVHDAKLHNCKIAKLRIFRNDKLRNENGEKVNVSTIRENTKSAHATQTISKLLWNDYYNKKEE